jgi:uncharacterized protein YidB (DUF937 family)
MMGLFDNLAGSVLGKMAGDQGNLVPLAMEMFNQYGGLAGILEKFNASGFTEQAASWVAKGENVPLSAEQIVSALGASTIAEMANKLSMTAEALSEQLAQKLPKVIDKLTPDGVVSNNSAGLLNTILGMLK